MANNQLVGTSNECARPRADEGLGQNSGTV